MIGRALVAHCDWGRDPRKRWMAVAVRAGDRWRLMPPEPVGATSDLLARLTARADGGGVMVGFDFPIGLPEAYGEATGLADFPSALRAFGTGPWSDWYDVCDAAAQITLRRPFYPQRPGGTRRWHLSSGLGLPVEALTRRCERATPERQAACMLFWTLGGNQVGKGAIAGWRELIAPNLGRVGLWPFDGPLATLDAGHEVIFAETYPGEAYGHIGISRRTLGSKRSQEGRRRVAGSILGWMAARDVEAAAIRSVVEDGFSALRSGEDQFDAVVGLLGMLDVLDDRRSEGVPDVPAVVRWEGWILGQTP